MQVTPTRIDFGIVVPGETYSRTVRLSEVATDRFVFLKEVDPGRLPIAYDIDKAKDKDGLAVYRVRLQLHGEEAPSGKQTGQLVLSTDSHLRPQVSIPVEFAIAPRVRAVPSVVSLGTVPVGTICEKRVRFVARNGESLTVKVETTPTECSVQLDETKHPPEMIVRTTLHHGGIWQAVIKAKVFFVSQEETIEIKCVGYGRKSS